MAKGKTTTTAKRKRTAKKAPAKPVLPACDVPGCGQPGLETHEGPTGKVTLCGRCGELARKSLADEQRRLEVLDLAAGPGEKAIARQALRRHERVKRTTAAGGVLLG